MFSNAILEDFNATAELVALCDSNPGRLALNLSAAQQSTDACRQEQG